MARQHVLPVRVTAEMKRRLDAKAASLSRRMPGVKVTRSHVLRMALLKGLPLVLLVLVACSFEVPRSGAQAACLDYIDALERKSAECKDAVAPDHAGNVAHCDHVVAVNPLNGGVDRCIEDVRNIACADRSADSWCSALMEEQ